MPYYLRSFIKLSYVAPVTGIMILPYFLLFRLKGIYNDNDSDDKKNARNNISKKSGNNGKKRYSCQCTRQVMLDKKVKETQLSCE